MSVLVQSSHGWVLDARSFIDQGYTRCIRCKNNQKSRVKCCFKRQYFYIVKSHNSVNKSAAADGGNTEPLQKTDKPPKVIKLLHMMQPGAHKGDFRGTPAGPRAVLKHLKITAVGVML